MPADVAEFVTGVITEVHRGWLMYEDTETLGRQRAQADIQNQIGMANDQLGRSLSLMVALVQVYGGEVEVPCEKLHLMMQARKVLEFQHDETKHVWTGSLTPVLEGQDPKEIARQKMLLYDGSKPRPPLGTCPGDPDLSVLRPDFGR